MRALEAESACEGLRERGRRLENEMRRVLADYYDGQEVADEWISCYVSEVLSEVVQLMERVKEASC